MTETSDLAARLRAAADRLLAGAAMRSAGRLTVVGLAQEAGIKRWVLTHQQPDLMRAYQAEFQAIRTASPAAAADPDVAKIKEVATQLREARSENQALTQRLHTYAGIIQELTEQLELVTSQRDQAIADRDSNTVVMFPRHRLVPAAG